MWCEDTISFFFSSRRRHTRSLCDWSSDVCSSDLADPELLAEAQRAQIELNPISAEQLRREIGRASCRGKSVDLGGRRIIKKKKAAARLDDLHALRHRRAKGVEIDDVPLEQDGYVQHAHGPHGAARREEFHFFFSSRRRHTRSLCDWSSDVCSSDLVRRGNVPGRSGTRRPAP